MWYNAKGGVDLGQTQKWVVRRPAGGRPANTTRRSYPFRGSAARRWVAVVERRADGVEAGCKAARRRRGRKVDNATTGAAGKAVVEAVTVAVAAGTARCGG